jgi:hypothetical protein
MADQNPEQLQKQIDAINESLNKTSDKIKDIGKNLTASMVKGLVTTVEKTRQLAENLGKSKDVSKDITAINKELNKQVIENEKHSIAKIIAEKKLDQAVKQGNASAINRAKTELQRASIQLRINQGLEDELRTLAQIAENKKKESSITESIKKGLESINQKYFSQAAIFKVLIDSALRLNKVSVDVSKNFGYSADESNRVAGNLKDIAQSSQNVNMTTANLGEAMNQLGESTGFVSEYSADTLKTQVMLTKQFGLTGEEAAGIYNYSVLTGQSSSQVNKNMVGAYVATRNQLGVGVPFKAVMAEAAKVSGELAANLGNNPVAIVKAVTQAKALGTTLEQTKAQGDKLLDFESSIESQLKAQLLTGEAINLDRARAAALAGDQIALAQELASQGMTLNKFENMNVLAKRAYAEALGLTSDQLSDQLRKQKLAEESGKSLAQITAEEALEAEQRQSIQDKFNASVLKLQDLFGSIAAGPLGTILTALTNMMPLIEGIITATLIWQGATKMIAIYNALSNMNIKEQLAKLPGILGFKTAIAGAETTAAVGATTVASAMTFGVAAIAIAAGIATIIGAMSSAKKEAVGDMISPADGKTQVSTREGGLFELSKNDDLVAGPGLAKNKGGGSKGKEDSGGGGGGDNQALIAAMNGVKASVDKLYDKKSRIVLDGRELVSSMLLGSVGLV